MDVEETASTMAAEATSSTMGTGSFRPRGEGGLPLPGVRALPRPAIRPYKGARPLATSATMDDEPESLASPTIVPEGYYGKWITMNFAQWKHV